MLVKIWYPNAFSVVISFPGMGWIINEFEKYGAWVTEGESAQEVQSNLSGKVWTTLVKRFEPLS